MVAYWLEYLLKGRGSILVRISDSQSRESGFESSNAVKCNLSLSINLAMERH